VAPDWKIEPLGSHHVRGEFDCGEPSLSAWLKHQASQFIDRDLAKVYVLLRGDDPRVWGYYSISTYQVRPEELPPRYAKGLPQKMGIPAVLIGKLALDKSLQGQRMGGAFLNDALRKIRDLSDTIGIRAVVVDAIDERARDFYLHHQFIAYADQSNRLFIPLSVLRRLSI
jgi:GNAT superfamily N-acetyltransferase